MTKIEQLKDEEKAIKEEISKLNSKAIELAKQIWKISRDEDRKRFDAWGLKPGTNVVCFSKHPDYHWSMIKAFTVGEICEAQQNIDVILAVYREDDSEYSFRVEQTNLTFASLEDLENEYNIYIVDSLQFDLLRIYMCQLLIDYKNLSHYEDIFSKNATLSIKISK